MSVHGIGKLCIARGKDKHKLYPNSREKQMAIEIILQAQKSNPAKTSLVTVRSRRQFINNN